MANLKSQINIAYLKRILLKYLSIFIDNFTPKTNGLIDKLFKDTYTEIRICECSL